MATINISLPNQLRDQANKLVNGGYYSSFSDLVRTAIRSVISDRYYDLLIDEAKKTKHQRKGIPLTTDLEIDEFINSL